MKPLLIVNDVHLGVRRTTGTTPATAGILKDCLQGAFLTLINQHYDKDLCIAGDLFDAFEVSLEDVLTCYTSLCEWIMMAEARRRGDDPIVKVFMVAGNHDSGKRNDRVSSFGFLCEILHSRFRYNVVVVDESLYSHGNVHMVPHCMNQDLFNMELEKALEAEPGYLILHANVDNGFAENSDHSLNVDGEWLTKLSKKHQVLFAHEHQARMINYGYHPVTVMGNQWPSSVSDCLTKGDAQKDGQKYAHIIAVDGQVERAPTWNRVDGFVEIEWQDLSSTLTTCEFVRVTGTATASQATDVINAIAAFRKNCGAYVITNGVHIEGMPEMDMEAASLLDRVTSFDVLQALYDNLNADEVKVVKSLMEVTEHVEPLKEAA